MSNINIDNMSREELIMEINNYQFVPGHGPDYKKLSDDELRIWLERFRDMFRRSFEDGGADNE